VFHLICFGGLRLDCDGRPLDGAAVRRRSLALLAFVASRREQGVSRDKVLGYFWPETDTNRARNNLKQTLFIMRRSLGDELLVSSDAVLRINTRRLTVDSWEFEAELDQRLLQAALVHYRGAFLDGVYISTLPEFGRWAEAERQRLAWRYQEALEALALRSTAVGEHHGAVGWWRRVVEHDPLSSRTALRLMKALIADGDRIGALKYAKLHESLLRAELGVDPDTGERDFVEQLRQSAAQQGGPLLRSLRPSRRATQEPTALS
jgi:DNA-binding SARP family transcriptional activator